MRIIAELGSCHENKWDKGKALIDMAKEAGVSAVKFQLFQNDPRYTSKGNIWLSPELFHKFYTYCNAINIDCSASVFDEQSLEFLLEFQPPFIKLAHSMKEKQTWIDKIQSQGIEAIVSCDIMTDWEIKGEPTKLYCVPEYPVRYHLSFEGLFPRFNGFSDHTLGINQMIMAYDFGAQVIEKHMRLDEEDRSCPDARFAITAKEMKMAIEAIRLGGPSIQ